MLPANMDQPNASKYRAVATKEPQREGGHGTFFAVVWRGKWFMSYQQALDDGLSYQEKHPDLYIYVEESQGSNRSAGMGV